MDLINGSEKEVGIAFLILYWNWPSSLRLQIYFHFSYSHKKVHPQQANHKSKDPIHVEGQKKKKIKFHTYPTSYICEGNVKIHGCTYMESNIWVSTKIKKGIKNIQLLTLVCIACISSDPAQSFQTFYWIQFNFINIAHYHNTPVSMGFTPVIVQT